MARRVQIRSRTLNTDIDQLEEMVIRDYKEIWKQHIDWLEGMADEIASEADSLVPVDSGKLRASISARVSKSPRWPGIMVQASAKDHGYDYATIQEENEEFSHSAVDEPGDLGLERMAHYLGGPFARELQYNFEELTGEPLELPENLQHAIDYIEERGG